MYYLSRTELNDIRDVGQVVFRRRQRVEHPMFKHYPAQFELQQICKAFQIGTYISTERNLGGMFNANVQIRTTTGTYVVRVMSGYATASHMEFVKRVMYALRKAKVPVVFPLKAQSGRRYSTLANRYVQVTRLVRGESYAGKDIQIYASGRMLRRFHDALNSVHSGPKPAWSNYPSGVVMERGLARLKQLRFFSQYTILNRLYKHLMHLWRRVRRHLPKTIIHGDWHLWNQLYSSRGTVRCVLDFDFIQKGERLLDIGKALWNLLSNNHTRHLAGYFLTGYGPLTRQEHRALPVAVALASMYEVCVAPLLKEPIKSFRFAFNRQIPFLKWILSGEGLETVRSLYTS